MDPIYARLQEKFPFLSVGKYLEQEYIGIIQNCDNQFLSMYVYNHITDEDLRKRFIKYGEIWWWETNRLLPINLYIKEEFRIFKSILVQFSRKEFDVIHGPMVSLNETMNRRIKRKQIQLIKAFK